MGHDPATGINEIPDARGIAGQRCTFQAVEVVGGTGTGDPQHLRVDRPAGEVAEERVDGGGAVEVQDGKAKHVGDRSNGAAGVAGEEITGIR
jgi:hypothetical protein